MFVILLIKLGDHFKSPGYVLHIVYLTDQGTDLRNNKTRISSRIFCFLDEQFYYDQQEGSKVFVSPFLLALIKLFQQENNNILGEILFSLFSCFLNPFPGVAFFLKNGEKETKKQKYEVQLILYKRYLECTLVQWRLSIFSRGHVQVAVGTFFMKSPVMKYLILCKLTVMF